MKSIIYALEEKTGRIEKKALFSLAPKNALVAFVMQAKGDFHTWNYPENLPGMRQGDTVPNHWYYDDVANGRVLAAYPA